MIAQEIGLPDWKVDVKDGEESTFYPYSAFSKGISKCSKGAYSASGEIITFDYSLPDKETMLSEGVNRFSQILCDHRQHYSRESSL